jgi:two-component system response regulator PhoP
LPLDVAIVDLGLPKLPGLELIRRVRAQGKSFPILILTARDRW